MIFCFFIKLFAVKSRALYFSDMAIYIESYIDSFIFFDQFVQKSEFQKPF